MTDEEEQIAFKQWLKDWGDQFPPMNKKTMFSVYRSMDEANRREFLEEAQDEAEEFKSECNGSDPSYVLDLDDLLDD